MLPAPTLTCPACPRAVRVCLSLQHVYRKWSSVDIDNYTGEKAMFAKVAPSVIDDAKMGWRTIEGQVELNKEVRAFCAFCILCSVYSGVLCVGG